MEYTQEDYERLFEINENLEISHADDNFVIIDNFYKNYEELHDFISKYPKYLRGIYTNDFDNGRTRLDFHVESKKILNDIILTISKEKWGYDDRIEDNDILINSMKLNIPIESHMQHWPHVDPGTSGIVYLDKISSGGTVLWEVPEGLDPEYLDNTLTFGKSYFRDISKLNMVGKVEAKPNRLVILNARKLHGGYIDDHSKYLGQERFQQIIFTNRKYTVSPREEFDNY